MTIEFKTKIAYELEKVYLAGFSDGIKQTILQNIVRDNDEVFEAFLYFTKTYLQSLEMKDELIDNHLNHLKINRNKQEPKDLEYNL